MSGSPEAVRAFMDPLFEKAQPGARKDRETLRALKRAHLQERGEPVRATPRNPCYFCVDMTQYRRRESVSDNFDARTLEQG